MSQFQEKVALVTGGGGGIGRAIAIALGEAGAAVAILGRNIENLDETRTLAEGRGAKAIAIRCDVTDHASVEEAFEQTRSILGPVDILVNNAGVTASARLQNTDNEVWENIIQTNLNGTFYCCKAALPGMVERNWGRIIMIASMAALGGLPFSAAYSASKHAQLGLTRSLALEVARYNIAVNAICPGWVETDMLENAVAALVKKTGRSPEDARADLLSIGGQGRAITPEEVAAEALRLASLPDATTNGQAISLM